MKMEHKEIIERARMHGVMPSVLAHELLVHDLVETHVFELGNISQPYKKLNEGQQQEVIDRITEKVTEAVRTAVAIISSRNVTTIPCKMKQIQVTEKTLTVTSLVDAKDPARHGLTDSAGHLCLLVLAPDDYAEGLDFIRPDRDQREFPLHVSELTGSLFDRRTGPDEPDGERHPLADGLDALERADLEQAPEMLRAAQADHEQVHGKEFGDYTYEDAAQLVVLKATIVDVAWLQHRFAIDSDQATSLLLRFVDNEVVELETEADLSIDNTYKVLAKLEDLGSNLNLE